MGKRKQFFIGDKVYIFNGFEWAMSPTSCHKDETSCSYYSYGKCQTNLREHWCKHVVYGDDIEKKKFVKATSVNDVSELTFTNQNVINIYKDLTKKVIDDSRFVGFSASKHDVKTYFIGNGQTEGFVDYTSYCSYESGESCGNYKIISSYYKEMDVKMYWIMKVIEEYGINKSAMITDEVIKEVIDLEDEFNHDDSFEPVDLVSCAFYKTVLMEMDVDFDNTQRSIAALYFYLHDIIDKCLAPNTYQSITNVRDYMFKNISTVQYSIIMLYIELFYDDTFDFSGAYPLEFISTVRIDYSKGIDYQTQVGEKLIFAFGKKLKKDINNSVFSHWGELCEMINKFDESIIANYASFDVARQLALFEIYTKIAKKVGYASVSDPNRESNDDQFLEEIKTRLSTCTCNKIKDKYKAFELMYKEV